MSQIFMQSTEVAAERSAAEITALLVRAGARQIATDYEGGKVTGLRFVLAVAGRECAFDLPARTEPVYRLLLKQKPWSYGRHRGAKADYEAKLREDAERIGWRQLFRWTQAQLAMIDAGMVSAHEVFLPYLIVGHRTVLRMFEEDTLRLLPAPGETAGDQETKQ